MKTKVLIISVLLSGAAVFLLGGETSASEHKLWQHKCASCHDGKTAPVPESLVEKYKTVEEFTKGVQTEGHKAMNILKDSLPLIERIAQELGIKESQGK
jgi:hypothetical protein